MMMLIGHAEQVTFIVKMDLPLRLNQQEAVHRAAFRLQGGAPGDQRVGLLRFGVHPGDHLILRHRLLCGFHREARGEHLRQDNHIAPGNTFQLTIKMAQVGRAIHPH